MNTTIDVKIHQIKRKELSNFYEIVSEIDQKCFATTAALLSDDVAFHLIRSTQNLLLASSGKNFVGFCIYDILPGNIADITRLAILPDFRRRGIATQLINSVKLHSDKQRCVCCEDSLETQLLLRSNNFYVQRNGVRRNYFPGGLSAYIFYCGEESLD